MESRITTNLVNNTRALMVIACLLAFIQSSSAGSDNEVNDPEPTGKFDGPIPVQKIRFLIQNRRAAEAQRLLEALPRTADSKYMYTLWRGLCLAHQDEAEKAHALFTHCMPLHDVSIWARSSVAGTYAAVGCYDEALNLLKEIPANIHITDVHATRSQCYSGLHKYNEAASEMLVVAKCQPGQERRNLALAADLFMRAGNYKQALITFNQAFDQHTSKTPVGPEIIGRAGCLVKLGRLEDAVKDFTAAIASASKAKNSDNASAGMALCNAYLMRARCYDKLGKPDLAARDRAEHERLSKSLSEDMFGKHAF